MTNALPSETQAKSRVAMLAGSIAATVVAALLLIFANKLVGYAGRSAGMRDACWQLTTVRAALAASTVTALVALRRDHLLLLGALYGVSLALTHGGPIGFFTAAAAGAAALALRHGLAQSRLQIWLPAVVFVATLSLQSLVSKVGKVGAAVALETWTPDLLLRLLAAALAAGGLALLSGKRGEPSPALPA